MKTYFGYIRVSTTKQGEQGSSLQEQKAAIEAYANRHGLKISEWFEEQETAAAQGRPVFNRMLKSIERKQADGVITHKIDRSARNLKDWAHIGELIDRGVEMHFAHESLDLMSRSGRLSADILAVVASDYIRNLRDEVRKGFYGRLKQGIYPLKAPIGYLDQGGGKPKIIDPERGPLVAKAFELYATGRWSIDRLGGDLYRAGLRNSKGGRVTKNGFSTMLNNPFYVGILRVQRTGETFLGCHEPLIDKATFDAVQSVLKGRMPRQSKRHHYRYQRLIRCGACNYHLIAERQKGNVYYRCHTPACPVTCVREDDVDRAFGHDISTLAFSDDEWVAVQSDLDRHFDTMRHDAASHRKSLELAIAAIDGRLATLTDAVLDSLVDRPDYLARKEKLLHERAHHAQQHDDIEAIQATGRLRAHTILQLARAASQLPNLANDDELHRVVRSTTSNLSLRENNVEITWRNPFCSLVAADAAPCSGLHRDIPRTTMVTRTIIAHAMQEAGCDVANDDAAVEEDRAAA